MHMWLHVDSGIFAELPQAQMSAPPLAGAAPERSHDLLPGAGLPRAVAAILRT